MIKTGFEFFSFDIRICFGFLVSDFDFLKFVSAEIKAQRE